MIIDDEIKSVIGNSAFLSLVTMGADGNPHPIVAGKGEVTNDTITFGIYRMEKTQKNLTTNMNAWVVAASTNGGPKGYRLSGTAAAKADKLIFTAAKAEALL